MKLVIDVGNSSITCGIGRGNTIVRHVSCPTKQWHVAAVRRMVRTVRIQQCVLSSVVPSVTAKIVRDVRHAFACPVAVVGKTVTVPLAHWYRPHNALGTDRALALTGARTFYRAPLIVVDCGTALTVDYLDKNGVFQGGMIIPGMATAFAALKKRAAQLPKQLSLVRPRTMLGTSTAACMRAGIVYGYAALVDGLIARINSQQKTRAKVILTGGWAHVIAPFCTGGASCLIVDQQLILKSLLLLS